MKISDLKKTTRENTPAIVTAVIIFLLVGMYMAWIVPANEQINDSYNKSTLEEFNLQFNNTLKDFASQVDTSSLKGYIAEKAAGLCDECTKNGGDAELIAYLQDIRSNKIIHDIKDNVILESVRIDSISDAGSEIIIHKRINLRFDPVLSVPDNATAGMDTDKRAKTLQGLCCIKDTSHVDKGVLKGRLNGAIAFKNWVIYSASTRKIILDQGIEKEEFDSIKSTASKSGVLLFKFSDKRFYRQSVTVEGTNNTFMLVGAISQTNFELQSKRVNLNLTFISALFVILLLLSIPLIKPLISSRKERLSQLDMLNTTSAIGFLAIVLVSFSFSQFLSKSYQSITSGELQSLNDSVAVKLNNELQPYYDAYTTVQSDLKAQSGTIHYDLAAYIKKHPLKTEASAEKLGTDNFQNFFTFNSKGDLIKDISAEGVFSIRKNFSERDYFKALKEKKYSNILTTVFSKYDNRLKFVFVKKNPVTDKTKKDTTDYLLTGFAFSPEFMNDFKFNSYNGYMLCNNTGRVILNSEIDKSLNEDIYANSQKNYSLSKMLHGMGDSIFELNYNGEPCLFFAKKYNAKMLSSNTAGKVYGDSVLLNDYPLYMLTYRKLGFSNNLQLYTIINGFIITLGYVLGITLLVLLYSVFFFLGDISILSRNHLHWMFPDNSRKREYILLKWINYAAVALFVILFITGFKHVLYLCLLSGINIAFINFIFLNQRVFILKKEGSDETAVAKRLGYIITGLFMIAVPGYVIPFILYNYNLPSFGLSLSLLSHFIILYLLKKDKRKDALPKQPQVPSESSRCGFVAYFMSILSFHYILVPMLIIFSIFISEINMVKDLDNSNYQTARQKTGNNDNGSAGIKGILKIDGRVIGLLPVEPPSKKYLEDTRFDNFQRITTGFDFKSFIEKSTDSGLKFNFILLLLASLIVIFIVLYKIINYYSGRFFFFELAEGYRLGYFSPTKEVEVFTNKALIIPPYSEEDLQYMEIMEKHNDEIPPLLEQLKAGTYNSKVWLKGVPGEIVSNQIKIELIMRNHFETYRDHYKSLWNLLSEEEKFVMNDFAIDYFVNYKNRNTMIQLMKKGYIIADPLTGRLRIMNYGFRNFIVYLSENAPESAKAIKEEEESAEGTYSKWKLPLMIIAISGIVIFMYMNKDSFNHVLLVGGSAASAIGLIAKFLNVYKQN